MIIYLLGLIFSFSLTLTLQLKEITPEWMNDFDEPLSVILLIFGSLLWFIYLPIILLTFILFKIIK